MSRESHLALLRILHGILAALFFLVAAAFVVAWCLPGLIAILHGKPIGWLFLVGGLLAASLVGGLGRLHYIAAGAAIEGRRRVLSSVLAILQVFNFPLGTVFAVYTFWLCWFHQPTKVFFDVHDRRI